jgi:beta-galactosidase
VDIIHPTTDLNSYECAFAPTLHLVDADLATHLEDYVRNGGHLLATIRSGYRSATSSDHHVGT